MTRRSFFSSCLKAAAAMLAPACLTADVPEDAVSGMVDLSGFNTCTRIERGTCQLPDGWEMQWTFYPAKFEPIELTVGLATEREAS